MHLSERLPIPTIKGMFTPEHKQSSRTTAWTSHFSFLDSSTRDQFGADIHTKERSLSHVQRL